MRRSWFAAAALGAVVAALGVRAPRAVAQPASQPPSAAPAETPEQAIQRDLAQQAEILTSSDSKPEQREQAAERLVLRQRPDARDVLLRALNDTTNRSAQVAVAKALAAKDPHPDPRFIQPLLALLDRVCLNDKDRASAETVVGALVKYGDTGDVLTPLIAFARDTASGPNRMVPRVRKEIVSGIGSFTKKAAARFLIEVVNNGDEDALVRRSAFDALIDMTGLQQFGTDLQQWNQWWAATANQPDVDWENAVNRIRASQVRQVKDDFKRLSEEIKAHLKDEYRRAPDAERTERVLSWLRNGVPAFRVVAAQIVQEQNVSGVRPTDAIKAQLRSMIGDSSVEVRYQVIISLKEINDPASLDPLLAQIAVETDPDVKIAIAQTLARLKDVKAVDALLPLLKDPSARVAESAAEALRDLGELIVRDPALSAKVSAALKARLGAIDVNQAGIDSVRAALLEGMAPLRDPSMLTPFSNALNREDPRNTVKVRIAACKGLGNMPAAEADPAATALVDTLRKDSDAPVRLEAVRALAGVGNFGQAEALYQQMDPRRESDRSVRDAAWNVLADIFKRPDAPVSALLNTWVDRFKGDLPKLLVVRQAAREKLVATANDPNAEKTLATLNQDIGDTLSRLGQWDKAAASFRSSMKYWQEHKTRADTLAELSRQLMTALLRSGGDAEAIQFAGQRISADPQELGDIGYLIRTEIDRRIAAGDKRAAVQLIDEVEKMQPPLTGSYAEQIKQKGEELKARL